MESGTQPEVTHVLVDVASALVLFELYAVHVKNKRKGSNKCKKMVEAVFAASPKVHVSRAPAPVAPPSELPDATQEVD